MDRLVPQPTPTSEPYWQGCNVGELRLQKCTTCAHIQFYPRIFCTACGARDLDWVVASGRGHVASFTIVRQGVSDAYATPFVAALIDLAEGPRMMSHIVGEHAESIKVGDSVIVCFEAWNGDRQIPVFQADLEGGVS